MGHGKMKGSGRMEEETCKRALIYEIQQERGEREKARSISCVLLCTAHTLATTISRSQRTGRRDKDRNRRLT